MSRAPLTDGTWLPGCLIVLMATALVVAWEWGPELAVWAGEQMGN